MNPKNIRSFLLKYGIATLVGGILSFAVFHFHGFANAETWAERLKILADAFTIPGVVLIFSGLLVWIGNQQMFSGITYAGSRMFRGLIPFGRSREVHETYYDYVSRKREKGGVKGYGFLFHVGGLYFALALIFFVLFYIVR